MLLFALLAVGALVLTSGKRSSSGASDPRFWVEDVGGIMRVKRDKQAAVFAYLRTQLATLRGVPSSGVPMGVGAISVMLVAPPRELGDDTMPAMDWVNQVRSHGYAVMVCLDAPLLAAVGVDYAPNYEGRPGSSRVSYYGWVMPEHGGTWALLANGEGPNGFQVM